MQLLLNLSSSCVWSNPFLKLGDHSKIRDQISFSTEAIWSRSPACLFCNAFVKYKRLKWSFRLLLKPLDCLTATTFSSVQYRIFVDTFFVNLTCQKYRIFGWSRWEVSCRFSTISFLYLLYLGTNNRFSAVGGLKKYIILYFTVLSLILY